MTIDWRILGGLTVVLIAAFAWLLIANANLRAATAIAQTENAALHIDNAAFKDKIERQNKAVAAFKSAEAQRTRRAAEAAKAAGTIAQRYRASAQELLKQKTAGDGCKASGALIDRYVRENQ